MGVLKFLIILLLFSCQHQHQEEVPTASSSVDVQIKVGFVGDVILHERLRKREEKTQEGFATIWSEIQSYFETTDLLYANLEGPVAPDVGGVTGYPMFNFPESIIPALQSSGFSVVSTANNHALDRSAQGVEKTIQNLNKHNLKFTGTRAQEQDPWWALTEVKSLSTAEQKKYVAWLACTEMVNGNADKKKQVLYCYKNEDEVNKIVKDLIQQQDILAVIVTPHWGAEDTFKITETQRKWAQRVIDSGAVAVVGSHPHVLQTIETYQNGVIAYSLGNFVSNQSKPKNKLSLFLYLKFSLQKDKLVLSDTKAFPLWLKREIQKDGTAKYRSMIASDLKILPKDAQKIWADQISPQFLLKDSGEL